MKRQSQDLRSGRRTAEAEDVYLERMTSGRIGSRHGLGSPKQLDLRRTEFTSPLRKEYIRETLTFERELCKLSPSSQPANLQPQDSPSDAFRSSSSAPSRPSSPIQNIVHDNFSDYVSTLETRSDHTAQASEGTAGLISNLHSSRLGDASLIDSLYH
ncbi:hypothetical protein CPC08DRAFT_435336 [Agrocybe pediades]|nr:hypothetical protein CPC08DRAFT_435336 [Agrocybe pediades]